MSDIERLLRTLKPDAGTFDRDEAMYRAGRASVRGWLWPAVAGFSTLAAVVLAVLLALKPAPAPSPPPPPPPAETPAEPMPVLASPVRKLEEDLLDRGLDALGAPAPLPPAQARFPGEPL